MAAALLDRLIDYAGVFPPANHSVQEAVSRYRAASAGPDGWILGPMLVRAGQIGEAPADLPIGMVADLPLDDLPHRPDLVQVERRYEGGDLATLARRLVNHAPVVYLELTEPDDHTALARMAELRHEGLDVRAKIRTGGATAEAFPSIDVVADFITACVERFVPFKATAGLHHPFRAASTVPGAVEHGFVNMLAAVRVALSDEPESVAACLADRSPRAFDLDTATWRGVGADVGTISLRHAFRSIGSCSFEEPAGYLRDLGFSAVR